MGSVPRGVRCSRRHGQTGFDGCSVPPAYSTSALNGSATISFDVDPKGKTANLHVEQSSNPALESEAIGILRGWRFRPGVRDGEPVSVRCTLEFVKANGNTHP